MRVSFVFSFGLKTTLSERGRPKTERRDDGTLRCPLTYRRINDIECQQIRLSRDATETAATIFESRVTKLAPRADQDDLAPFQRLLDAIRLPCDDAEELVSYAEPASVAVTASWRTFCGT
jgi:hypothetical protein